jgi:hypothetical protein
MAPARAAPKDAVMRVKRALATSRIKVWRVGFEILEWTERGMDGVGAPRDCQGAALLPAIKHSIQNEIRSTSVHLWVQRYEDDGAGLRPFVAL